jgi:hypothetical protein
VNVRPDDLANLCALYSVLRLKCIISTELQKYVQKSMLIDSTSSALEIIQEGMKCALLSLRPSGYFLTNKGRQLGDLQKDVRHEISERAKEFLIKKLYLSVDAGEACCYNFLMSFRVDTVLGSFVFDRKENESADEVRWLQRLSRVGLLEVDTDRAKINCKYLDLVNGLLRRIREGLIEEIADAGKDKEKIGSIAEKCALDYEKRRLEKKGHKDLAMVVQHISLVDKSAGYDILSYRGTGKTPGSPIFIEVKGTGKQEVEFIWTRNERFRAEKTRKSYWIYVFTNVEIDLESAAGPIRINDPIINLKRKRYCVEPLDVRVRRLAELVS